MVYLFKCVFIVISDFVVAYCLYGDDQVVLPYYVQVAALAPLALLLLLEARCDHLVVAHLN